MDPSVPEDVKRRMVRNMEPKEGGEEPLKRLEISVDQWKQNDFLSFSLDKFVLKSSFKTLRLLNIPSDCLQENSSGWNQNEEFIARMNIVKHLQVVNDLAERGVKLMSDFTDTATKDENQKQFILQVGP